MVTLFNGYLKELAGLKVGCKLCCSFFFLSYVAPVHYIDSVCVGKGWGQ